MAVTPVLLISLTPKGIIKSMNDCILSGVPTISAETELGVMSTIFVLKIFVYLNISSFAFLFDAVTLIKQSSLTTDLFSGNSVTFIVSISLFTCFSTCSRVLSSPITVNTILLMPFFVVLPTVIVSMLKPLLANIPAILAKTPGWSSTSIEIIFLCNLFSFAFVSSYILTSIILILEKICLGLPCSRQMRPLNFRQELSLAVYLPLLLQ